MKENNRIYQNSSLVQSKTNLKDQRFVKKKP